MSWFGDLGIPILALGGYSSECSSGTSSRKVKADGRPAKLLYVGDADAAGLNIFYNFVERTDCWEWDDGEPTRLAVTPEQVEAFGFLKLKGKTSQANLVKRFVAMYGSIFRWSSMPSTL